MAEYVLENEKIKITINNHGAELRSLVDKSTGREAMWCGDSAFWGRVSPVLFPVVGAYRNKESRYEGKTYQLGQHGFARDKDFTLIEKTENSIRFSLEMTKQEAQENGYPFAFYLELGYELTRTGVKVLWKVTNPGEENMFFSIGGHPAFAAPVREQDNTTCYLQFEGVEMLLARTLEGGLASHHVDVYKLEEGGILPVTEELFAGDALVIENSQTGRVSLLNAKKEAFLTVVFDAPLFGVWTPPGKNAPFICIEPWYGRCDAVNFIGTLEQREWGNMLKAGDSFEASYTIEV